MFQKFSLSNSQRSHVGIIYHMRRLVKRARKRADWQQAVQTALTVPAEMPPIDPFAHLERCKRVALHCARRVLGESGGNMRRLIPHHSDAARRLMGRLKQASRAVQGLRLEPGRWRNTLLSGTGNRRVGCAPCVGSIISPPSTSAFIVTPEVAPQSSSITTRS